MTNGSFNQKAGQAPSSDTSDLPLFFKKPLPLDINRHINAGLMPSQNMAFAANTNSIIVNAVEFFEACRHYPIVFTQDALPLPAAIMGLEQSNYFVNDKGRWKDATYIPAYVRKYPFVFMSVPERSEFLLCVDEASDLFKLDGGKDAVPIYKNNAPSELTRNALEFCTAYHNQHQITRQFCDDIKKAGLLTATRSDVKLANGRDLQLSGFLSIDEKKLNELPDATVLEFFKKGWMPLIYASLMSGNNWKKLVDMAGSYEKKHKSN
jgi:hypothetical protein